MDRTGARLWARAWAADFLADMEDANDDEFFSGDYSVAGEPDPPAAGSVRSCFTTQRMAARLAAVTEDAPKEPKPAHSPAPSPTATADRLVCGRCQNRVEWMTDQPSGASVLRCLGCGDGMRVSRVVPSREARHRPLSAVRR